MADAEAENALYHPLNPSKREVRFMRMLFDESAAISCELGVFSLDDQPEYDALSYAWTEEAPIHLIHLNGHAMYVRPNLYAYFELMRKEHHQHWIFIDALCINQGDVNERSMQVSLMGDLYRNAAEVIAWLGISGELGLEIQDEAKRAIWQKRIHNEKELEEYLPPRRHSGESPTSKTLNIFYNACSQYGYWSRLWIVQEVILAKQLSVRYGGLQLPPKVLLRFFCQALKNLYPIDAETPDADLLEMASLACTVHAEKPASDNVGALFACKTLLQREKKHSVTLLLSLAICQFTSNRCSIPHDKIYGILGLTDIELQADYNLSLLQLYITVFIDTILESTFLAIITRNKDFDLNDIGYVHISLLRALGLPPDHPTVATVTDAIFRVCGDVRPKSRSTAGLVCKALDSPPAHRIPALLKRLDTRTRIATYRLRPQATLPKWKNDSRRLTYGAWTRVVEDVFFERISLMRRRCIDGLTRAYRLRTRPFTSKCFDEELSLWEELVQKSAHFGTVSKEMELDAALDELVQHTSLRQEWLQRVRRYHHRPYR